MQSTRPSGPMLAYGPPHSGRHFFSPADIHAIDSLWKLDHNRRPPIATPHNGDTHWVARTGGQGPLPRYQAVLGDALPGLISGSSGCCTLPVVAKLPTAHAAPMPNAMQTGLGSQPSELPRCETMVPESPSSPFGGATPSWGTSGTSALPGTLPLLDAAQITLSRTSPWARPPGQEKSGPYVCECCSHKAQAFNTLEELA